MKPQLAFDLDGTLLDCRHRQVALTQWLLERHGAAPLANDVFWEMKRNGASTEQAIAVLYDDSLLAREVALEWRERVEQPEWLILDRPLPGVHEVLGRLQKNGVRMGLLTARGNRAGLDESLSRCGLISYFPDVEMVDPAHACLRKTSVLESWVPSVFIGDTESDYSAAHNAGIPFIALTWGQRSEEWLAAHGAANCLPDLNAAIELLFTDKLCNPHQ